MPIYAYRCEQCGHAKDVIQKFSDAPLTVCPSCGADAFRKQLTAPAFQLKGSGWYVTDFRDGGRKPGGAPAPAAAEGGSGASTESAAPAAPAAAAGGSATPAAGGSSGSGGSSGTSGTSGSSGTGTPG